jgi:CubicO group peptidase (beta-lactamase class C family)
MRVAVVAFLFVIGIARAHAQEWPTATPESQGMDSAALAALVEYGGNASMDSLVVVRNGRIVTEAYWGPYRAAMKHRVNSTTKAVIGSLVGIAIARGDMPPVTTPVAELLPRAAASGDPRWKDVTVQHLLDMTSGMAWEEPLTTAPPRSMIEMERSADWETFILQRPMARTPGAVFDYNSGNSHLLSLALARRTGITAEAYARKHLFEPLGIADVRWRRDPQGTSIGGYGLYLHTRDMARLGQLYLQGGEWNGRQVVPREWVARVFQPQVEMGFGGLRYGDAWWSLPARGVYMMVGYNRQVVMVMPELNLVAAMTGRSHYPFENVIAHLQRAARSATPLAENPEAAAQLRGRVEAAVAAPAMPAGEEVPPAYAQSRYQVEDNPLGVREIAFDFHAQPPAYRMALRNRSLAAALGTGGRFAETDDAGTPLFTRTAWKDASTLLVEQRWPEEAATVRYELRFSGDDLQIIRTGDVSGRSVVKARRVAQP